MLVCDVSERQMEGLGGRTYPCPEWGRGNLLLLILLVRSLWGVGEVVREDGRDRSTAMK